MLRGDHTLTIRMHTPKLKWKIILRSRYTLLGHIEIDENELQKETCVFFNFAADKDAIEDFRIIRRTVRYVFANRKYVCCWRFRHDDSRIQVDINVPVECLLSYIGFNENEWMCSAMLSSS